MKRVPTRLAWRLLNLALLAVIGLSACTTAPPPTPCCQPTPTPSISLVHKQTGSEDYIGERPISKDEWIARLKPGPATRGFHTPLPLPLMTSIKFDKDVSGLSNAAKQQLDNLSEAMTDDALKNQTIVIEGHTDSKGSDSYNLRLSRLRADEVKQYLLTKNADIGRHRITAKGMGKAQPIEGSDPEDPINRRVVIYSAPRK